MKNVHVFIPMNLYICTYIQICIYDVTLGVNFTPYRGEVVLNAHKLHDNKLKQYKTITTINIPLRILHMGILTCFICKVENQSKIAKSEIYKFPKTPSQNMLYTTREIRPFFVYHYNK